MTTITVATIVITLMNVLLTIWNVRRLKAYIRIEEARQRGPDLTAGKDWFSGPAGVKTPIVQEIVVDDKVLYHSGHFKPRPGARQ